ncbi:NAC domain-containing protein 89 [Linum grandiflorum]
MLNTLVPPLPPVFSDQLPILGSGTNGALILPTSPNVVFDTGDERLMSHYPTNDNDFILPTSPNSFLNYEDNPICHSDERLMRHYPMNGSNLILPTSPNRFLNEEVNSIRPPNERLMSHYSMDGSSLVLPTSPNNFLSGVDSLISPPKKRLVSHYQTDGSCLILPTSPNRFLNEEANPIRPLNERLMSHYPIDGSNFILPTSPNTFLNNLESQHRFAGKRSADCYSPDGSSLVLPTSPNNILISQDNSNCAPGERLTSHYATNGSSTLVLPTSPNNFLGGGSKDNRFCPSDERLISHYLKQKMLGNEDQVEQIPEVDILSREPWDLLPIPGGDGKYNTFAFLVPLGDLGFFHFGFAFLSSDLCGRAEQRYKEAYYFCRRRSYFKSKDRYKRTTGDGYWKPTGKPRHIRNGANGEVIGSKRCLVFHFGRSVGKSTGYTMHEYSAASTGTTCTGTGLSLLQPVIDLVLCKVMKKSNKTEAATKRSNKKAKTASVSPPPSDENVNAITPPPLQQEEEAAAICQMTSDFGNRDTKLTQDDGGIAAFPEDIELNIDGEVFRLLSGFKFDFEPSDVLQQQKPQLEAEYFPGMVQQSG